MIMANKSNQEKLDRIKQQIIDNNICTDLAAQATQLVFGSGSPMAEVVLIGEAPGKNEDLTGEPFVGAAGKFLDEMLQSIQLKRKDIYITNIVKYRPPNNRDPFPDEKQAFLPYLYAQLEVIKPKVIITLGRHSMNCFLPGLQISTIHGQPKRIKVLRSEKVAEILEGNLIVDLDSQSEHIGVSAMQGADEKRTESYKEYYEGASQSATQQRATSDRINGSIAGMDSVTSYVVLPLYHPAAALYNGSMRSVLLDDFQKVPDIINQIETN
jgi:uracil-DNA glycosylase